MALPPVQPPFGSFIDGIVKGMAYDNISRRAIQERQNKIDRLNLETRRIRLERMQLESKYRNQYKPKSSFLGNIINPSNVYSGKRAWRRV